MGLQDPQQNRNPEIIPICTVRQLSAATTFLTGSNGSENGKAKVTRFLNGGNVMEEGGGARTHSEPGCSARDANSHDVKPWAKFLPRERR